MLSLKYALLGLITLLFVSSCSENQESKTAENRLLEATNLEQYTKMIMKYGIDRRQPMSRWWCDYRDEKTLSAPYQYKIISVYEYKNEDVPYYANAGYAKIRIDSKNQEGQSVAQNWKFYFNRKDDSYCITDIR